MTIFVKPPNIEQIVEQQTHAPISGGVDMLKSCTYLKAAATNSE